MTKLDHSLNAEVTELANRLQTYPQQQRVALLLNVITNVYRAGEESGRRKACGGGEEASA